MNTDEMRRECEQVLTAMIGDRLVPNWWASPNRAFDYRTPERVWLTEPQVVWDYLMGYAYGR